MKNKNFFIITVLLSSILIFSGCSLSLKTDGKSSKKGPDGGVFVSTNKGETWRQMALMPTLKGTPASIGSLDNFSLVMDPSDNDSIYYGSVEKGLFYTYNITEGWTRAKSLSEGTVRSIAVDPLDKCRVYAALGNKLYKSDDCSRSFSQVYFDNDVKTTINYIAIDYYDNDKIYIGTSRGELIKSLDKGKSWQTVLRAESDINKIVMNIKDSRIIFVSTKSRGVFRSVNGGDDWLPLKDNMKEFKNSLKVKDFVVATDDSELIFIATTYGILKSTDNGNTWERIELITPENDSTINVLAVSPKNSKEIYYATRTTFYSSSDGGESWTTRVLPSSRSGWKMLINPENTSILYLGVRGEEKSRY